MYVRPAKFRLRRGDDGAVRAEIVTGRRLGPERIGSGPVKSPAEYLPELGVHLGLEGPHHYAPGGQGGPEWRRVRVMASALIDGASHRVVERYVEFSEGSEERELLSDLVSQERMEVHWVNEEVTFVQDVPNRLQPLCQEALQNTRGLSSEAWIEEIAARDREFSEWPAGAKRLMKPAPPTVAAPPEPPVPFFAPRTGSLPRTGRSTLSGVRLPTGRRLPTIRPRYWISDDPLDSDIAPMCAALAGAFPTTGLWPLLWLFEEDPTSYLIDSPDLDAIGRVDIAAIMRAGWTEFVRAVPEAATLLEAPVPLPEPPRGAAADAYDPFGYLPDDTEQPRRLVLVPCHRPADALTVLGGIAANGGATGPELSAVLRSWEQRFAIAPIALRPSVAWVAVGRPPHDLAEARQLAAELFAFCPPYDLGSETVTDLTAALLDGADRAPASLDLAPHRRIWPVGWYD